MMVIRTIIHRFRGDKEVDLPLAGVVAIYVGAGRQELRLSGKWQLPEGLADRISHEPKLHDVASELTLTLTDGDNVIGRSFNCRC